MKKEKENIILTIVFIILAIILLLLLKLAIDIFIFNKCFNLPYDSNFNYNICKYYIHF